MEPVGVAVENSHMKGELSVTCRRCGRRSPSALQMDPKTFADIRLKTNYECCRLCSHVDRYSRDDYYFADETGRPN